MMVAGIEGDDDSNVGNYEDDDYGVDDDDGDGDDDYDDWCCR